MTIRLIQKAYQYDASSSSSSENNNNKKKTVHHMLIVKNQSVLLASIKPYIFNLKTLVELDRYGHSYCYMSTVYVNGSAEIVFYFKESYITPYVNSIWQEHVNSY